MRQFCAGGGLVVLTVALASAPAGAQVTVKTSAGLLQGSAIDKTTIRTFKGIPYAAPPVGDLRWQAPRPAVPWQGVRAATAFGPACAQAHDLRRHQLQGDERGLPQPEHLDAGEDWRPTAAGDGVDSRRRLRGRCRGPSRATTARPSRGKGVVLVTINYRLGVFGFFAHPELTRESGRNASGNYGMLDQVGALQWVQDNIAAFGGDPGNVTIFGESAGSFAVSALVASPLAQGPLPQGDRRERRVLQRCDSPGTRRSRPTEEQGVKFGATVGADSLAALRAKPAAELLAASSKMQPGFVPNLDGYFLAEEVPAIYAAGRQNRVPLLAGWNADEIRAAVTLRSPKPTAQTFAADVRKRFADSADAILKVYPASTDEEALESAAAMGSDLFIGYSTWKWIEMHAADRAVAGLPLLVRSEDPGATLHSKRMPRRTSARGTQARSSTSSAPSTCLFRRCRGNRGTASSRKR